MYNITRDACMGSSTLEVQYMGRSTDPIFELVIAPEKHVSRCRSESSHCVSPVEDSSLIRHNVHLIQVFLKP